MNMKKVIIYVTLGIALSITGCMPQSQPDTFNAEINNLKEEINILQQEKESLTNEIITEKVEKGIATYVVTIGISQSHMFWEIDDVIKDSLNELKLDIPVSEEFYNAVEIGTVLDESFRMGSFIMNGSIGNWDIKIVDKKIE